MIRQQSQIAEAENEDSGDEDSTAETGTNLHASLLLTLACSKKYTMTYYYCKCAVWKLCDFVASNPGFPFRILLQSCETKSETKILGSRLVIRPTSHDYIFHTHSVKSSLGMRLLEYPHIQVHWLKSFILFFLRDNTFYFTTANAFMAGILWLEHFSPFWHKWA